MAKKAVDAELRKLLGRVTAKRPRTVIEHILKHGYITTEEISAYGYNHPPRAARDVREAGIPLETFRVKSSEGRSIGAYRFGDLSAVRRHLLAGRSVLPKELRNQLYESSGGSCSICLLPYEERYLQIDHRVPYEIAGDAAGVTDASEFMLLCGSCQRKKSWSCEHCGNWETKTPEVCRTCYWANPDEYEHAALRVLRQVVVTFEGDAEARIYDELVGRANATGRSLPTVVKERLVRD